MVKFDNKVFKKSKKCQNYKKRKKKRRRKKWFKIFNFRKKCLNVCRSSQNCTGIILLELWSEGLIIQLKKIFCCWITLICTTKQQWYLLLHYAYVSIQIVYQFLLNALFCLTSVQKSPSFPSPKYWCCANNVHFSFPTVFVHGSSCRHQQLTGQYS